MVGRPMFWKREMTIEDYLRVVEVFCENPDDYSFLAVKTKTNKNQEDYFKIMLSSCFNGLKSICKLPCVFNNSRRGKMLILNEWDEVFDVFIEIIKDYFGFYNTMLCTHARSDYRVG
jgi:hypothetical protein